MAHCNWRQAPAHNPGSCAHGSFQMGGPPRALSAVLLRALEMSRLPAEPCVWFSLLTETLPDTSAELSAFHIP